MHRRLRLDNVAKQREEKDVTFLAAPSKHGRRNVKSWHMGDARKRSTRLARAGRTPRLASLLLASPSVCRFGSAAARAGGAACQVGQL